MMQSQTQIQMVSEIGKENATIRLPKPTGSPILLALGITLIFTGLLTSIGIGILGLVLAVAGSIGWFRNVLPHEEHEDVAVEAEPVKILPSREHVARIQMGETHRAQLPLQTYPVSSGITGGIIGGLVMVIPAEIYSILRYHSVWYVVNLLGGAGVGGWTNPTPAQIAHFRLSAFITANVIHGVTTLLVGLLYGALLPIWPKRPILLGGIVAPVVWTGLLHSLLGIINPYFQQHIDWCSFSASQVLFGIVAGYTVTKLGRIKQLEQAPLPVRLGVEAPGMYPDENSEENL